jgi:hypothetical protein
MILWVHGAKRHGAHFLLLLSHIVWRSLLAILYVNVTDLLHLSMDTNASVQEVHTGPSLNCNWRMLETREMFLSFDGFCMDIEGRMAIYCSSQRQIRSGFCSYP